LNFWDANNKETFFWAANNNETCFVQVSCWAKGVDDISSAVIDNVRPLVEVILGLKHGLIFILITFTIPKDWWV
jgi:hypothetical protein